MGFKGNKLTLSLGEYGMTGSRNLSRIPKNAFLLLKNTSLRTGNLTRCGGSMKYNSTPITGTPKLLGVYDWWPTAELQRQIVYADAAVSLPHNSASLLRDAGTKTFPTTMASSLRSGITPVFCEAGAETLASNPKLCICNGFNPVQVIDGDAVATRVLGLNGFGVGTLTYTVVSGAFVIGDVVTGSTSAATGTVTALGTGSVDLTLVSGDFVDGETISGSPSLAVASATGYTETGRSPSAPNDWTGNNQPHFLLMHNNRLVGIVGHNLYGSTVIDHENFLSEGSYVISVYPGQGLRILAGVAWNSRMYLFKTPQGIYWLDDSSTRITDWAIYKLTDVIGLGGANAICATDNDILWVSNIGHVHLLSPIQQLGDVDASDIAMQQNFHYWLDDNVDSTPEGLAGCYARYYPLTKEARITYRPKYGREYTLQVIVDFNRPTMPRFRVEDKDTPRSLSTYLEPNGNERPDGRATPREPCGCWMIPRSRSTVPPSPPSSCCPTTTAGRWRRTTRISRRTFTGWRWVWSRRAGGTSRSTSSSTGSTSRPRPSVWASRRRNWMPCTWGKCFSPATSWSSGGGGSRDAGAPSPCMARSAALRRTSRLRT